MRLNARRKCYCRWHRYRRCWARRLHPPKNHWRTCWLHTTEDTEFEHYNRRVGGMPRAQLERALADAQQAYLLLSTGSKYESVSFAQGDGSKSVSYTRANLAQLVMLIKTLQAQLGLIPRARAPLRFLFR